MTTRTWTLDALCAALTASFRNANTALATMPSAQQADMQQADMQQADIQQAGPASLTDAGFIYRLDDDLDENTEPVQYEIPFSALMPERRLALDTLQLQVRCYVAGNNAICMRRPPWWRRLLTPALPLTLEIKIATGQLSIRFRRALMARMPSGRKGPDWRFTLTPELEKKIKMLGRERRRIQRRSYIHRQVRRLLSACAGWWRR